MIDIPFLTTYSDRKMVYFKTKKKREARKISKCQQYPNPNLSVNQIVTSYPLSIHKSNLFNLTFLSPVIPKHLPGVLREDAGDQNGDSGVTGVNGVEGAEESRDIGVPGVEGRSALQLEDCADSLRLD